MRNVTRFAIKKCVLEKTRAHNLFKVPSRKFEIAVQWARQNALLHHIYAVLESASPDSSDEMEWRWPIWGSQEPEGPSLAPWASAEQSAVLSYHKERVALDAARKSMGASGATGSDATASNIALIKNEIQSKLDRRNAKGGKRKGGKKGVQGEE